MGNIISFLFPKPAPAALEAQEELGEVRTVPAKEAVEDQPPTAPARTKKIVEAPATQTIEAERVIENIGSIEDAVPAEPTLVIPEPVPEPIKEPAPEPIKAPAPEPIKEPTPEPVAVVVPTPEPQDSSPIAELVAECVVSTALVTEEIIDEPIIEPIKEPTPEPIREPTPEPIREPTPEPLIESTPDKIEEPQAGIANIIAETVENLVSVSEEVIDDDEPATVEGAAELRDLLEKPKVEDIIVTPELPKEPLPEPIKESSPEPQTTSSIASLIAETVGKASILTEEVIDDDESEEELIEATSHTSDLVKPIVDTVIVPEVPVILKSNEVVEVIGSIQDNVTEETDVKPSGGAALLRDILDD